MKKGLFRRFLCGALTGLMCIAGTVPQSLEVSAADQTENYTQDGYDYELWNQNGQGTAKMTSLGNGAFSCSWSGIENVLFRTGKKLGSTQTYTAYDGIYIDYDVDYYPQGNSYLCVYGWTENGSGTYPTVEYYIVEAWGSWRPPGNATSLGTVTSDGGSYDIYRTIRENQPSIHGTETFYQYWSVRKTNPATNNAQTHLSGTITVSNHFDAWANAGLDMSGKMYEVALNVEGYQSNGSATVNKNNLVFGSTPADPDPVEPDENGYYFYNDFEDGKGSWTTRGSTSVTLDKESYYEGSQSLAVTGREDTWQGTAITLDTAAFVPGNSYSFGTAVLQTSGSAETMMLTLQYTDSNGDTKYSTVASTDVASGVWTDLSTTSYTIPSGASNLLLYVESSDSTTDFYIDNAYGAIEGKVSGITTGSGTVKGSAATTTTTITTTTTTTKLTTTTTTSTPDVDVTVWGDANCNGTVEMADAVLILQSLSSPGKYGTSGSESEHITGQGSANADVYENGSGLTSMDALSIQKYLLKIIGALPESISSTNVTTTTITATTTTYLLTGVADLYNDFESSTEGWEARGSASLSLNTDSYYSGSQSLKVTGRTDTWNGAAITLDESEFKAGSTYSFSAAAMQTSGSSQTIKMTLQYNDADGEPHYDEIASASSANAEWTKLENTAYTIPEGATDLLLYIELPDSKTANIYIDDVLVSAEGTKSSVVTGGGTVGSAAVDESDNSSDIDPSKPMVAICFDDGAVGSSSDATSMRIINAIANEGFHATFFYVGNWVNTTDKENEVKYAYSKGMEIANHSTSHPDLTTLSASEIRSEYDTTQQKLKSIIGADPSAMMRLPYLSYNSTVTSTLNDVALISCSVDSKDWNGATSDQIISTIKNAMNDGSLKNSIVLCHETYDSTATAMEYLAPYLKEQGWQIVTVSELFEANGKTLNGGTVYTKCS